MNIKLILKMSCNVAVIKNFLWLHKRFRINKDYHIHNMIRCGLNIIKHDRLVQHDHNFLVNSFIPPINSQAFHTIASHVPGTGADFFENHTTGLRTAPISTYIAVTDKCMYHCWHCSANKFMKDACKGSEFTTEQLKEVVHQLQEFGVGILGFTGGEPLLRTDLEEVLKTIDKRSVTYLFTTGYHLTYERAKSLKEAGLFGVAISIDSLDEQAHNAMRQNPNAYKEAINAIQNAKRAGLYTMSQTVCTRELLHDGIYELAAYLKQLGVDEMRIMEPLPCGSLQEHQEAVLTQDEQKQLIQLHITLNKNKTCPKASVFPYVESEAQFGCGAGVQHSYIDNKGNFGACDFLNKTYGNIFQEDIHEIWKRMYDDVKGPHCKCIAKHCESCGKLPKFYRLMKGK